MSQRFFCENPLHLFPTEPAVLALTLFSGWPPRSARCSSLSRRRALPPPPPLPTFYRVAALSSPTFGGLAALLSSFPRRRIEFKLGPLSSSRRRIPSMRGLHRRQAPGAGGRELQGRPHPLSLPDPPCSSLARRDADAMEDAAPPLLRSVPPTPLLCSAMEDALRHGGCCSTPAPLRAPDAMEDAAPPLLQPQGTPPLL